MTFIRVKFGLSSTRITKTVLSFNTSSLSASPLSILLKMLSFFQALNIWKEAYKVIT